MAKYLFFIFLLLSSAGISADDSRNEHGSGGSLRKKILFLGDSLTAGYGLDVSQSYPSVIQNYINEMDLSYEVINAGVSGDTTAGGLRRLEWLLRQEVSVLVVALGANDGLRGFDTTVTKSNLEKIIDKARSHNEDMVILLAGMYAPPNMGEEYGKSYDGIFKEVAHSKNVFFLPFLLEGVAGEASYNLSDGIHPNEEGYKKVARTVWDHLKTLLVEREKNQKNI